MGGIICYRAVTTTIAAHGLHPAGALDKGPLRTVPPRHRGRSRSVRPELRRLPVRRGAAAVGPNISEHEPFLALGQGGPSRAPTVGSGGPRGWSPWATPATGCVCSRSNCPRRPQQPAAPSRIGVVSGGWIPTGSRRCAERWWTPMRLPSRRSGPIASPSERVCVTCWCAPTVAVAMCAAADRGMVLHDEPRSAWPATRASACSGCRTPAAIASRRRRSRSPLGYAVGCTSTCPLRSAWLGATSPSTRSFGRAAASPRSGGLHPRSPTAGARPGGVVVVRRDPDPHRHRTGWSAPAQ